MFAKLIQALILITFSTLTFAEEAAKPALEYAGTWHSILPPVLAIVIALIFRNVIPALFAGILLGAWAVMGYGIENIFPAMGQTLQVYTVDAMADADHVAVILFTLMIGGMVGITSRNGGMRGIVHVIVRWTNNVKRASLATVGMGMAIFFDDYANTLVVGNTMRPITDKLRISREKLAYFVDSTAAPIACIALISTWIGYEVGLIDDAVDGIDSISKGAYEIFLYTIPYSFYPILALVLTISIAATGRDFGPMLKAERRARNLGYDENFVDQNREEEILPVENKPRRAINALIPIATLITVVVIGLFITGTDAKQESQSIKDIIGDADSYKALLWGSLAGVIVAVVMTLVQGILNLHETVDAWLKGVRSMMGAMVILLLAWSLSSITEALETSKYLSELIDGRIPPEMLPALIFLISAATAFSTGSSWGVMAILIPLFVPLTWNVMDSAGIANEEHLYILYVSISSILAGAVWGDHCSPISDTTVLSSLACSCDHVDHVRTQIPYALYSGGFALFAGIIPVSYGLPVWISLIASIVLMVAGLMFIGKKVDD